MCMKTFRTFIKEAAKGEYDAPSAEDRTRERQRREKEAQKIRQNRELERAREQDFRKKAQDRKNADIKKNLERLGKKEDVIPDEDLEQVAEYLEDGTDELVAAYKKNLPGQN